MQAVSPCYNPGNDLNTMWATVRPWMRLEFVVGQRTICVDARDLVSSAFFALLHGIEGKDIVPQTYQGYLLPPGFFIQALKTVIDHADTPVEEHHDFDHGFVELRLLDVLANLVYDKRYYDLLTRKLYAMQEGGPWQDALDEFLETLDVLQTAQGKSALAAQMIITCVEHRSWDHAQTIANHICSIYDPGDNHVFFFCLFKGLPMVERAVRHVHMENPTKNANEKVRLTLKEINNPHLRKVFQPILFKYYTHQPPHPLDFETSTVSPGGNVSPML